MKTDGFVVMAMLMLLVFGASSQANLLVNPGFEDGATGNINAGIPGWSTWNSSGWHHNDAGRVIDTKAVKLWWTDSGIFQNFAVVAGHTYRLSGYMLHHTTDPLRLGKTGVCDKSGDLRVEWYDAIGVMLHEDAFGQITIADPTNTWKYCSADITVPAGAVQGRYLIRMFQPTDGDGSVNYDNASVFDMAIYGQAYDPNPVNGSTVPLSLSQLSWKNHDPNDVFTFNVYLEAEGPVVDPNFTSAPIATGITTNTLNLASAGVTLLDNKIYTWRVDTTDPNNGGPVTFTGPVWSFQIGDVAPVVNAGSNQYVWLVNGAGNFTLLGSYTDDGKSPITRAEWIQGTHQMAGGTIVTMGTQTWNPTAKTVTVSVNVQNPVAGQAATGWYEFMLEVQDAIGTGSDTVNGGVYGTCLEAALADPADTTIETNWPNGQHGDINGDCKTDLEDFALLALSWLDCMTVKAGCTP
jgi:hypothetical protein